jgi:glucokinase
MTFVGAIDIGATKALIAVRPVPLAGWDLRGRTIRIESTRDPGTFADRLAEVIRSLIPSRSDRLAAVGVGTPGPLDRHAGVIVHSPNQGWQGVPLGALLGQRLHVPIVLDDDANTGALGETMLGAGEGADPCAYVALGTGLGTGVVVDGAVLHGAHEAGGEVGHLIVDPAGPRCGCGHRGCVEAYAAGAGLERAIRKTWGRRVASQGSPVTVTDLFRAARAGDPAASSIVEDATEALARCFGALMAVADPAVIVVGGSIGLGQWSFVGRAARRARRYSIEESGSRLTVVRAALGAQSVLAGAAVLAARGAASVDVPADVIVRTEQ